MEGGEGVLQAASHMAGSPWPQPLPVLLGRQKGRRSRRLRLTATVTMTVFVAGVWQLARAGLHMLLGGLKS